MVVKPSFDQKGSDLLILDGITGKFSKFLIVQSKGRDITKPNSVEISVDYVSDQFLCFLYTVDEDKNSALYLFFPDQIRKWPIVDGKYVLQINKKKLSADYAENLFTKKHVEQIKAMLAKTEVKKYTTVFVDGIFLEKALQRTIGYYKDIWPDKELKRPDLISIVRNIVSMYAKFGGERKTINCCVFLSESFHLEGLIDIPADNQSFSLPSGDEVNVFLTKSNNLIAFQILEQLERIINSENIVLVADDITYLNELIEHKEKGADIILVRYHEDDESKMIVGFRWGDVVYPLAASLGLERNEW